MRIPLFLTIGVSYNREPPVRDRIHPAQLPLFFQITAQLPVFLPKTAQLPAFFQKIGYLVTHYVVVSSRHNLCHLAPRSEYGSSSCRLLEMTECVTRLQPNFWEKAGSCAII